MNSILAMIITLTDRHMSVPPIGILAIIWAITEL